MGSEVRPQLQPCWRVPGAKQQRTCRVVCLQVTQFLKLLVDGFIRQGQSSKGSAKTGCLSARMYPRTLACPCDPMH